MLRNIWLALGMYVVPVSLLISVLLLPQASPRGDMSSSSTGPKIECGPSINPVVGHSAMEALEERGRVGQIVDPQERIQIIADDCCAQELTNRLLCLG